MRLLFDTHALLWWLNDKKLRNHAYRLIGDAENDVLLSAVSLWEITVIPSIISSWRRPWRRERISFRRIGMSGSTAIRS